MATMPTQVFTRRIALIAEYGISQYRVPESGFTADYFEVIGPLATDELKKPAKITRLATGGERTISRVEWVGPDANRAVQAINGDMAETFGRPISTP